MNPEDIVLVAVVTSPRDLEIARVLGWYRIPVRHAPRRLEVDWLAFYQTANFGAERWSVRYYAPVRGHELVTRAELLQAQPEHPRAAEPYFKLQLGPLRPLARPIPSRHWRRLTFVYSTGERLMSARDAGDVAVNGAEGEALGRAVREGGAPVVQSVEALGVGPGVLMELRNMLASIGGRR